MSLASLLANKAPPTLVELEVVGAGASASSVVKCRVTDPGGYSRLSVGQIVAVKKVFVPGSQIPHASNATAAGGSASAVVGVGEPAAGHASSSDGSSDAASSSLEQPHHLRTEPSSSDKRRCDAIVREVSLLKSLDHPCIVKCFGAYAVDQHVLGILTEYCPGNNLRQQYRRDGAAMPVQTVQQYTRQMLEGLTYLHRRGVVHRDLKGLNVLLTAEGRCKLADFGSAVRIATAKTFSPDGEPLPANFLELSIGRRESLGAAGAIATDEQQHADHMDATAFYSMEGTVWWMAPEQFWLGPPGSPKQDGVTGGSFPADIWSLGCLVLEMCTGAIPFSFIQGGTFGLMHYLCHEASVTDENLLPPAVTASIPAEALRVIRQCLRKDPAMRPTSAALLQDPWVAAGAASTPSSSVGTCAGLPAAAAAAVAPMASSSSSAAHPLSVPLATAAAAGGLPSSSALGPLDSDSNTNTTARAELLGAVLPKVHEAAVWWLDTFAPAHAVAAAAAAAAPVPTQAVAAAAAAARVQQLLTQPVPVEALADKLHCPSLIEYLAPLMAYPETVLPAGVVTLAKFLRFVEFFGPFPVLSRDLVLLERGMYHERGYSPYGCYAGYESTDVSHLFLCALKYPWMQPHATQAVAEATLKHAPPGSFLVRFSSKYVESPGSLTLSVRGDHGTLHYRILRSGDDAWGFAIAVPRPKPTGGAAALIPTLSRSNINNSSSSGILATSAAAAVREDTLHFDTIEELVDHFAEVGIRSQRSDKVYRLRYHDGSAAPAAATSLGEDHPLRTE